MIQLEVRCCCDPRRLLGWLWVDRRDVYAGARLHFPLLERAGVVDRGGLADWPVVRVLELEVANLTDDGYESLAVKSHDIPLVDLQQIPTFLVNPKESSDGKASIAREEETGAPGAAGEEGPTDPGPGREGARGPDTAPLGVDLGADWPVCPPSAPAGPGAPGNGGPRD
jgi:hypothetical protein